MLDKEGTRNTYVGNRVKEIRQNTNINDWQHIPGSDNWADLPSRGCNTHQLVESKWWDGPPWLCQHQELWPQSALVVDEKETCKELKKSVCVNMCCNESMTLELSYFSKYSKIIRMTAWMLRFIYNTRNKGNKRTGEIMLEEYEEAEKKIIKIIQSENKEYIQKHIRKITMYHDKEDILRMKTKLILTDFPEDVKTPALLPATNIIVRRLVAQRHTQLLHAGTNMMITDLGKRFWIIGIRKLVKSVIDKCIICKRHRAKATQVSAAPLPVERVQPASAFEVTGVDLAGPIYLCGNVKSWIVIYTCAVYRAIHLELTESLSTDAFIRTFRRFIARRGRPKLMISDNGTNFTGTKNLLATLDWDEVQRVSTIMLIKWKLNAPTAAWWGGFFERMIKIIKKLLRRVLGSSLVSHEEMQTLLCDCEAVVNDRPLTYVDADDTNSLEPLRPSCFLLSLKQSQVGRKNPTVTLRVVDLNALVNQNQMTFKTLKAPAAVTEDHILGGVTWTAANEIAVHWLNRRQNYTVLRICNVVTDVCEEEHRQQPNGWVPIALPRFSANGDFYVSTRWSLEQADGSIWQHLYVSMRLGGEIVSSSITPGRATVNNFVGMDEANLAYYFTRTLEGAPWRSELRVAGARAACLSCGVTLPGGGPCAWAAATASTNARYLSLTCFSPAEPSATYIIDPLNNQILYTWEDNQIVRDRLVGKGIPSSLITTVPLGNGYPAPVRLWLPPGLDLNDTDTKYSMVYYVYSGPNTNTVYDTFTIGYHSYLTTSRNTVYMLADGRGAGLNGQDILYSLNNALGTVEVEDHFVILRQVLDRFQFIDRSRVAIWGHSYGGYATLLTMLHDDDHMFQCGVSGAPVTSWLYYNTMYTERYMGLPTPEDNLAGYQAGDVTLLAEKLRGHDFYVMHGNADDNVHYQNAAKLYRALQELDIPFEQMSYPDEAHSLVGVNMHRYNAMNRYFERCIRMPQEIQA